MTSLHEVVAEMQLTEVFATGSWDYQWAEFQAWRAPSGRFYWYEDSGCSCFGFGDDFSSASDFSDGDRDALERALRTWHASHRGDCPDETVIECLEQLRRLPAR